MHFLMTAALFFSRLIAVYSFLIWIRILLSWINRYPSPNSFTYYLAKIVDPYLNLFRTSRARFGNLDFSALIGIAVLSVLQSILNIFGIYGTITFSLILAFVIKAFWDYGLSVYIMLSIISAIFRMIASRSYNPMMTMLDPMPRLSETIRRCFSTPPSETVVSLISLVILILLYFVLKNVFAVLINLALRIPF